MGFAPTLIYASRDAFWTSAQPAPPANALAACPLGDGAMVPLCGGPIVFFYEDWPIRGGRGPSAPKTGRRPAWRRARGTATGHPYKARLVARSEWACPLSPKLKNREGARITCEATFRSNRPYPGNSEAYNALHCRTNHWSRPPDGAN